ncbi:MAG: P1 family peptidase [Sciscionella sp.]|nr:P1 family peptidase [Sciscionella sp.]
MSQLPGPHNAITDVPGILVGHHQRVDDGWATGTTVVVANTGAVGGVVSRGGAPGTRETDLLAPDNLVQRVHAICLTGGSAYGLAAADGVMRWLAERNTGFRVGASEHEVVPIVPTAVIFDLPRSSWGNWPTADFGYAASDSATGGPIEQGCVGAGTGAVAGDVKGGVGTASVRVGEHVVGALAVVNARGAVIDPCTGEPFAIDHELAGEFGSAHAGSPRRAEPTLENSNAVDDVPASDLNTIIGVVATDARLDKAQCRRLAASAHDGIARAVRPAHSMFDGDTIFGLATGERPLVNVPAERGRFAGAVVTAELVTAELDTAEFAVAVDRLYHAAATTFARAIVHGVLAARSLAGVDAFSDRGSTRVET